MDFDKRKWFRVKLKKRRKIFLKIHFYLSDQLLPFECVKYNQQNSIGLQIYFIHKNQSEERKCTTILMLQ